MLFGGSLVWQPADSKRNEWTMNRANAAQRKSPHAVGVGGLVLDVVVC